MEKKIKRTMIGEVVSNKMSKAVVVEVHGVRVHPKYHKRFKVSKRFPAAVDEGTYSLGDKVEIQECAPRSKTINWLVVRKLVNKVDKVHKNL
jgi:small subunit ribosomal protein S17